MACEKKRVAVIGTGPAGLCTLKHLSLSSEEYDIVAFERNFWPGGLWVYTDMTGKDEYGVPIHSAMYKKLKTNLPKELQEFPGFPYPKEWNSYISRQQCLQYLNEFIDHFDIRKYIKTNTLVREVSPISSTDKVQWSVKYSDIRKQDASTEEIFDAVFVCNGHDSKANIPTDIADMDKFCGKILHSRDYRHVETFANQKVAIVGMHYSGEDIAIQVSTKAKRVYAVHRRKTMSPSFPDDIIQKPPIVRMTETTVVFSDGTEAEVDSVIFCTGYKYSFPFLQEGLISTKNERVTPLYKHMVHIEYPSLIFVGIPKQWNHFPQIHNQSRVAVAVLEGIAPLPSKEEMRSESDQEYQDLLDAGKPVTYYHFFGDEDRQWRFNKELADWAGIEPLPPVMQKLNDYVMLERFNNLLGFNKLNYEVTDSENFKVLNK
ncbi:flavin-containing monooxygenase 3-like [Saccostrea echinata]|uniref:flavin-containing monooxygenase 3-like n=1 Tax=Saccostrea echinata TaxID=191078 RepID=UPI002A800F43|nr:flavin-containing monooxygenase 3-like [Saccostrea echinata]